jgi:hypothetical protein
MKKKSLIVLRIFCFFSFTISFLFYFSACVPTSKRTGKPYDSMPPPPPPPPPPMNENVLSETTLQKIESVKTLLGAQLTTVSLSGNKENDYLVKVMQLNYGAINNLPSAQLGNSATNEELNRQADYFLSAMEMISSHANKDVPSDTSVLKNSAQKKGLNEIKDELVRLSKEYRNSGMDASVVNFATKIIKDNETKN